MKNLTKWWQHRLDKYYLKKRWHLVADIVLATAALTLLLVFVSLWLYRPQAININPVLHIDKQNPPVSGDYLSLELSAASLSIHSDKEFKIKIKAVNSGKYDITDLELSPLLSSNKFSFSRIKSTDTNSKFVVIGRKIVLDKILAGQSEEIELALVIKNLPDSSRVINWKLNGVYQENGSSKTITQSLPDLKLTSSLNVKVAAYYNSPLGDQLGSGPIPPQALSPTNYWLFFTPQNIGNKLEKFMVSAKIADHVSFYGRKSLSAGNFSYNDKQRRVTWIVDSLDPQNSNYQAGFELQLIPDESQVGSEPVLLTDIVFSASDLFSGDEISGQSLSVTTELPFDAINKGQGTVIK